MRAVRGAGLLAAAAWIASACNGALTFDQDTGDASTSDTMAERPPADTDAGADGDASADSGGTDGGCADGATCGGWRLCGPPSDDNCTMNCPSGGACTNGSCGAGCVAECKENSSCSITAGDAARVECETGASCTISLGTGGKATCSPGSNCRLQCLGACALTCGSGATCQLRCGDAAPQTITGTTSCP